MKVLDHGHLTLVESWGSDEQIIEAARMSTGKGFLGWDGPCETRSPGGGEVCGATREEVAAFRPSELNPYGRHLCWGGREHSFGDEKLLRFLYENQHHTPFEMAGAVVEVQAPIFVFREWHRHRVPFSYNEMSARYTPLPNVNYVPTVERLMLNSKTNKQAGTADGAQPLREFEAELFIEHLEAAYSKAEWVYQFALEHGVPKELARIILPVGRYSRMRASSNLRGWMNFLKLRAAPSAQWEIRQYAEALQNYLAVLFPRSMALFTETQRK